MCMLNENQIALVISDVKSAGINYSHLSTDLIDHICCDIESHMDQGIPFDTAYKTVKKEFGIIGLKQIQQNTLMLIDKNYRIMKKSMKVIGVVAMSLMAFGALFKIMHWPGASIILTLSFFFTTLVFFPSLLLIMFKEANNKKHAILYLVSFIGGVSFMVGVLFRIMHWPGAQILIFIGISMLAYLLLPMILISKLKQANSKPGIVWLGVLPLIIYVSGILFKINLWPGASILLAVGSIFLILVFIPFYYSSNIRNSNHPRVDFLFVIIALSYFVIFSFSLRMNHSRGEHNYQDIQKQSFKQSGMFFEKINQEKIGKVADSSIIELNDLSDELIISIEEVKVAIVKGNNKTNRLTALALLKSDHPLQHPYEGIDYLLPSEHPNSPIIELDNKIDKYIVQIKKHPDINKELLNEIMNFKLVLNDFNYQYAKSALKLLTFFQYQLHLCNYKLINSNINQIVSQ